MPKDFLFELGTEELPPKALKNLLKSLAESVYSQLEAAHIAFDKSASQIFASPRRLAIRIANLAEKPTAQLEEKFGPPVNVAFDSNENTSKAGKAFLNSLGYVADDFPTKSIALNNPNISIKNDGKTDKLFYQATIQGIPTKQAIPRIIESALNELPIPKRMRWGARKTEFVRPVHWVVMLFGSEVLNDDRILDVKPSNQTRGHRFHSPGFFTITSPADYQKQLRNHYVEVCFELRRNRIIEQVNVLANKLCGTPIIDRDLLNEVTSLVEWPVALAGNFESRFLEVPQEALISSMSEHQKYFHVVNDENKLMPYFITVANIESKNPRQIINGNERVIRPRLTDAAFFFSQDKKHSLESRLEKLKAVTFQEKLGSLYDKSQRISRISAHIAVQIGANRDISARAGLLCKADLVSDMVLEFDNMQGIAGQYYADNDKEPPEIGIAIYEHYLPKGAADHTPATRAGAAVALADRLDTLVGIFGIGHLPTGSKDPFALRRAAIGILNIILKLELDLGLFELITFTEAQHREQHNNLSTNKDLSNQVLGYIMERFRAMYIEQGISQEVFNSVAAKNLSNALDFNLRIQAVNAFTCLPEAESLAIANKRVSNLLSKSDADTSNVIDQALLTQAEEIDLFKLLQQQSDLIKPLINQQNYTNALKSLAALRPSIDAFFNAVMVNVDNQALRTNRLSLLSSLRKLFLSIADISYLVPEKK